MVKKEKTAVSFGAAMKLAEKIIEELSPGCEQVEFAGSLRRKKQVVGDLDIVCIPRWSMDLFGEAAVDLPTPVNGILADLVQSGRLLKENDDEKGVDGRFNKTFFLPALPEFKIDIWLTTKEKWGVIYTLRTGSERFNHSVVRQQRQGGKLPNDLYIDRGRVWRYGAQEPLDTSTEAKLFDLLVGGWVPPEQRHFG